MSEHIKIVANSFDSQSQSEYGNVRTTVRIKVFTDLMATNQKQDSLKPFNKYILFIYWIFSCKFQVDEPEIRLLNVDKVWEKGFTGKGIVVAVVDDGVTKHGDLGKSYVCLEH